ncbi:MAG TPA: DNA-processing protein DprA [Coleofasciculaceae cyanobacterium]|jgi:DNA processing protein
MEQERAYWLAWSQINGIGAVTLKKIYQHFGSLEKAWNAPAIAFAEIDGLGNKFVTAIQQKRIKHYPAELITQHLIQNPQFWIPAETAYPRLLLEIPSPPPLLYYLGQVEPAENQGIKPMIGIVGTRNPTEYGKRWTRKITQALVSHGFGIVSGMAAGIDTVAHQACLEANGRTIAVLGTGVDTVYPYSNRSLYQRLIEQGLIVSEYPAQTPPDRNHFPARNRIIAGLCRAVLIMEAPQRSGALITARFANDFCRDVYVLPGSLDNTQALGCLALLNSGAHIVLGIENLLEMLGTMPCLDRIASISSQPIPDLNPELEKIYRLLDRESVPIDSIVEQTGLDISEVLSALSQLELMDLVLQLPGMRYQIKN